MHCVSNSIVNRQWILADKRSGRANNWKIHWMVNMFDIYLSLIFSRLGGCMAVETCLLLDDNRMADEDQ